MAPTIDNYDCELGSTKGGLNLPPEETYYGVTIKGAHYLVSKQDLLEGIEAGRFLIPTRAYREISHKKTNSTAEIKEVPKTLLASIATALKRQNPGLVARLRFDNRRSRLI